MERQIIERLADNVRKEYNVNDNNFDIEQLLTDIGGKIQRVDTYDYDACIEKNKDNADTLFTIQVSKKTRTQQRKKFSIAHELGHFFLHMLPKWNDLECDVYYRDTDKPYSETESEANFFAACLLMPRKQLITVAESNFEDGSYQLDKIAKEFGVSVESVDYRGKAIGLWQ